QKIPILEDDEKHDRLRDADKAEHGALLVESAENGFPNEDHQACGAKGAANLRQRKEDEKARTESDADPRLRRWPNEPKRDRRRNQEQNKIRKGIKNHTSPTRKFFGKTGVWNNGANASEIGEVRPT